MSVGVIHPDDRSTDFLKLIYEDKNYDVFNGSLLKEDYMSDLYYSSSASNNIYKFAKNRARDIIERNDKIIILGHGTPSGLLNPLGCGGYIVDDTMADLLKEKEVVSIWCYSNKFFENNNIFNHQFHTGMIISETLEQLYVLGRVYLDKNQQLKNMENFARIVGECIEGTPDEMREYVLANYVGDDPVTQFNRKNILVF